MSGRMPGADADDSSLPTVHSWMNRPRATITGMMPDLGLVARLIGDPVRSKILFALLDGGELPAAELARRGAASPQSASGHLAKLVDGGLVDARRAGRQRLFHLRSAEVARAIEVLASIAPVRPVRSLDENTLKTRLTLARSCYDHLAGRLGVAVTAALVRRRDLRIEDDVFVLTGKGRALLESIGVDVDRAGAGKRRFARACMDWTERRPHLAGALGAALLDAFVSSDWVRRNARDRALAITPHGHEQLERLLGLRLHD
jgi:DNA-binding transcriptional ArsR family regulator